MRKYQNLFYYILIATVVLIHLFAYRVWLFSSGILTQGDWVQSLPNYSKSLLSLPIIWKSYSMGSIDLTPPFYPFLLLQGILSNLGAGYGFIERITFMWPIALLTIPFSYALVKSFTKNPIAALAGSLVYSYNTYFLILQSGQLTLMTAFTFAPLVFYFFKKTVENRSLFYAVLSGLCAFITSVFEFRVFYILAIIGLFYYLYYLFVIAKGETKKIFKQTCLFALLPIFIVFLLNIYWILPYMLATVSLNGTVLNRDLFGKEFFNISKALTLFHPFWTGDKYYPFITQPIPFYFFLLPLFVFLGVYLNRKNKDILFYALVAVLGIFLVKQNNPPFPSVYVWLYDYFPGFGAFREASKFYFLVALGYSVLIGSLVDWIWDNWQKSKLNSLKYLLTIFVISLSVWNLKTLILGTYGTLFVNRTMPSSYITINNYIDNQNEFFRTFWIPTNSRWGTNTDFHPALGEAETISGIWKPFSDATKFQYLGEQFINFYNQKFAPQLLDQSSIKYVIVPLADSVNDDNFFPLFGARRNDYLKTLDKTDYLKRITVPENDIAVYENKNYKPHIYTTNIPESLKENVPFKKVIYSRRNNSEYTMIINNISAPFYLQLSDSYHPDWRIHVGSFHWYGILFDHNYFLPNTIHSKNTAELNSFYINPSVIKQNTKNYTINSDGTINLTMTLYFVPQTYTYIGFFISVFVLAMLIIYLLYYSIKAYEKNK